MGEHTVFCFLCGIDFSNTFSNKLLTNKRFYTRVLRGFKKVWKFIFSLNYKYILYSPKYATLEGYFKLITLS